MTKKIVPSNGLDIVVKDGKPYGCRLGNIDDINHAGEVMQSLYDSSEAMPFIVGDLCNAIRDRWADWEQILPDIASLASQKQLKTLQNWSSLCDRLPHDIRRVELSFSHHAEVAYVEYPSLKIDLLDWAIRNDATVSELREEKRTRVAAWQVRDKMEKLEQAIQNILALTDSDDDSASVLAIRKVCEGVLNDV